MGCYLHNIRRARPPLVERRRADASLPAQLRDRLAHLSTLEHRHDLAVRKPRPAHLEPPPLRENSTSRPTESLGGLPLLRLREAEASERNLSPIRDSREVSLGFAGQKSVNANTITNKEFAHDDTRTTIKNHLGRSTGCTAGTPANARHLGSSG